LAALAAFVFTPFALVWGRASMMEYLATAGAIGFAWATIVWRERGRPLPFALALVAGLVGLLVKPTTAAFWVLPAIAYRPASAPELPRRRLWAGTTVLVAVPLAAAWLWTRHADAIKGASPTTAWLTSEALEQWHFGTLEQRFALHTWDVILARVGLTLLAPAGVVLLAVAIAATVRSEQRRFWLAVWAAAVAPPLVLTNLYLRHDYYLVAISPALAALIGLGAGFIWSHLPRRPVFVAGALLVALLAVYSTLEFGRSYWLRIHGAEDDRTVMPLAQQIARHTDSDDRVAMAIADWSPAYLYYADRWGHMVVAQTEDVAYDLIRRHDYRHFVAYDDADLRPLDRWPYLGALDRNLYALGDDRAELSGAEFAVTHEAPGRARRVEIACNGGTVTVAIEPSGTWLDLGRTDPTARIAISEDLAALPLRRYTWISAARARDGRARVRCTRV
jgi:hypothetical protein